MNPANSRQFVVSYVSQTNEQQAPVKDRLLVADLTMTIAKKMLHMLVMKQISTAVTAYIPFANVYVAATFANLS